MTNLSPDQALALLASRGSSLTRWPAEAAFALPALAARDAAVAAAWAEAQALDAALNAWAQPDALPLPFDVAAITALPQAGAQPAPVAASPRLVVSSQARFGWRPALLAASLALVVAVGGWLGLSGPQAPMSTTALEIAAAPTPSTGAGVAEADAAFAYVFSPTAVEEDVI